MSWTLGCLLLINYLQQPRSRLGRLAHRVKIADKLFYLDYSRVEVAADERHRVCSCGRPPQMRCNEADAVRSARL